MRNDKFELILDDAHAAASRAIQDKYDAGDREQPFNCGFAWVNMPATTAFARYCREMSPERGMSFDRDAWLRYGSKADRGWQWWKPGEWPEPPVDTRSYQQDMDFHVAAARAFAECLKRHGVEAQVGSRLD